VVNICKHTFTFWHRPGIEPRPFDQKSDHLTTTSSVPKILNRRNHDMVYSDFAVSLYAIFTVWFFRYFSNKVSSVMGLVDSWPATVSSVVVFFFSFMKLCIRQYKQAVPVECLDWWLFPLIHSLGKLPHFCLNGQSSNPETPKIAKPYFRSRSWWQILNREARIPIRVSQ